MSSQPKDALSLSEQVARRLAQIANVPEDKHEEFYRSLERSVRLVWLLDWRAFGTKPSDALEAAAEAARKLLENLSALNAQDRAWLERLLQEPDLLWDTYFETKLFGLLYQVERITAFLHLATDKPTPWLRDNELLPLIKPHRRGRGREPGTVGDLRFQRFVEDLLTAAQLAGGKFTLQKRYKKGSLITALRELADHLPKGFIPKQLSTSMLQRIKRRAKVNADNMLRLI